MTPNPIKGEVPLKLSDGRVFTIVLDRAGLVKAAQAHTGRTKITKLLSDIQPLVGGDGKVVLDEDGEPLKDTIPATCAMLYGAMDAYHPEVTLRDATNILLGDVDAVSQAISDAVELGFPDAKSGEDRETANPPLPSQNAKSSGRNGVKPVSTRKPSGARPRASSR